MGGMAGKKIFYLKPKSFNLGHFFRKALLHPPAEALHTPTNPKEI